MFRSDQLLNKRKLEEYFAISKPAPPKPTDPNDTSKKEAKPTGVLEPNRLQAVGIWISRLEEDTLHAALRILEGKMTCGKASVVTGSPGAKGSNSGGKSVDDDGSTSAADSLSNANVEDVDLKNFSEEMFDRVL
jgi:hypothetical protein